MAASFGQVRVRIYGLGFRVLARGLQSKERLSCVRPELKDYRGLGFRV